MIIQLAGKVKYPITLDPTVWIFDDRKIIFDDAFGNNKAQIDKEDSELQQASDRFNRELYEVVKPPVNKSINRFEKEKILTNTYVMPIVDFINTAEMETEANKVILETINGSATITIDELTNCLLLFASNGKPIQDQGPVHLYFGDGSNKTNPIKGIKKIIID
ncbi:hypothetical protein [Aquibacillus kalidii]|uniref:hypothetical protein n=1 Tax=Aquibacillus kalidii TaxID=2762597 RepID=UPI001644E22B|nr:hypothetical protein [Aquibacillus kalidii]